MQTTIEVVLPVFALVLCGYVFRRRGMIGAEGVRGLTNFVFYIAIPVLLFHTVGRNELPEFSDLGIMIAYFGGTFAVMAIAFQLGRAGFGLPLAERAIFSIGSIYPNGVLLGIPLVFGVFGEDGLLALFMLISFHGMLLLPVPILMIEIARQGRGGIATGVSLVRSLAENPVIVGLVAGLAWAGTGWTLPPPVDTFAGMLSQAAGPCALFALGATLAGYKVAGNLKESAAMVVFKLFVHPAAVWLIADPILGLEPMWTAVAVILAAMPSGLNTFILASKYDIYMARATSAILVSTVVSMVTVAVLLAYFAPG